MNIHSTAHISDYNMNQMSNAEERLISTMLQGVSRKQTSDILKETMPQGVAWRQTSDMSTESSVGPHTTTYINDCIVNQTNKTEKRFNRTTTQGVSGKQTPGHVNINHPTSVVWEVNLRHINKKQFRREYCVWDCM